MAKTAAEIEAIVLDIFKCSGKASVNGNCASVEFAGILADTLVSLSQLVELSERLGTKQIDIDVSFGCSCCADPDAELLIEWPDG